MDGTLNASKLFIQKNEKRKMQSFHWRNRIPSPSQRTFMVKEKEDIELGME